MNIKEAILDLIFPKFCLGCESEGKWLCEPCEEKIVPVKTQVCPECGRISQCGSYCSLHKKTWGLAGIITACYYKEGPIKELIHNFKYNHIIELRLYLGDKLCRALRENIKNSQNVLITAVPMHFLRRAQRGYNQAELLGDYVANNLKIEKSFKILQKIRRTKPQVLTEGKKRTKNLEKCFKINKNYDISGRTIVLVDDVTTTGTTLNECAKVLRKAGARKVWGLVVSRG